MAKENVGKFQELLRSDEELQAKFRAAAEAFEGDKTDEAASFAAVVVPLAEEAGLPFTLEEARQFMLLGRELNDAELEAVAGGSTCYIVGGGGKPDADINDGGGSGGACAYVGITMANWD